MLDVGGTEEERREENKEKGKDGKTGERMEPDHVWVRLMPQVLRLNELIQEYTLTARSDWQKMFMCGPTMDLVFFK